MTQILLAVAGSLSGAISELAARVTARTGQEITLRHGPAGKLAELIFSGFPAEVYVSASATGPVQLYEAGLFSLPRVIAGNRLVVIARPGLLDTGRADAGQAALDLLARPDLRIGMSTPGADPSGDYTLAFLNRLAGTDPARWQDLPARAHSLYGGDLLRTEDFGRSPALEALRAGKADLLIGYGTSAQRIIADLPGAQSLPLPLSLAPPTEACASFRIGASGAAQAFCNELSGAEAAEIFARFGFSVV
ncbi:substrate-binding domain-containing protein [Paracoccus aminophilus]|nr:substrate-binding domain-containing protein [Paracoccus aminophilus]